MLRRAGVQADLAIVSAGCGLIPEDRVGPAAVRRWADLVGIPAAVRSGIRPYPLVVFLLGEKYMTAVPPPVRPAPGQRLIFCARTGRVLARPVSP